MNYKKERAEILANIKNIIYKKSGNSLIALDCSEEILDYIKNNVNIIWDVINND